MIFCGKLRGYDSRSGVHEHPIRSLGKTAAHFCMDMQTMFAERTDWHVLWQRRL